MFEEIITRLQRRKIKLETDQSLQDHIDARYRSALPIDFTFTLFNLAYAIGTCRSVAPTKADKFPLAVDFLHLFTNNNNANELRITINNNETILAETRHFKIPW
jgi:hypothetical protein